MVRAMFQVRDIGHPACSVFLNASKMNDRSSTSGSYKLTWEDNELLSKLLG